MWIITCAFAWYDSMHKWMTPDLNLIGNKEMPLPKMVLLGFCLTKSVISEVRSIVEQDTMYYMDSQ